MMVQINQFFAYEEYAARCASMQSDMDDALKASFVGQDIDRAVENLYASLNSVHSRGSRLRRALGVKDLLIKVLIIGRG